MLRLRRVVTGHDERGRSRVLFDGPPTQVISERVAELWFSDQTPASNRGDKDTTGRPPQMLPPAGGSIFRYVEVAPESETGELDATQREAAVQATLAELKAEGTRVDTSRHPGMHRTQTLDYVVLLSGRLTMLLDEGEVELQPFDLVVQRGTNHAWVNRGSEPAILLAVNLDAEAL